MVGLMTTQADITTGRTRSVDNLQRLYTIVIGLAVTESLKGLLLNISDPNIMKPSYNRWLMFISLIVTVVPFYHGANRYLDATYVTRERSAKPEALMLDFILLFIEGLGFFILAMLSNNDAAFYTVLASLFILDSLWVGITNLMATGEADKFHNYSTWASANILAASFVLLSVWSNILHWDFWPTEQVKNIALVIVVIARTAYDYIKVWHFYYPKDQGTRFDLIPAPPPAPLPPIRNTETTH
jgi:hypothetical protein